ncbi:Protein MICRORCHIDIA 6 [Vigna angularis]|uniref:Protein MICRORCHIDIA 6 n=1 Tax=Phaseolus angularis TaxID=3914 RepID=A0A8T0KLC8_PHAAN|nr:Protein MICRORCHIDIA 6 [Vigna angularis]
MGPAEIVDLSSDDESETVCLKAVKLEGDFVTDKRYQSHTTRQDSEENLSSTGPSTGHSNSSVLEQGPSPVDDTGISYVSPIGAAPLCRQFWKAGNYDDRIGSKVTVQNAKSYLHVHPMFLHSNATSHKWAFGAIAELLDNAVDERTKLLSMPGDIIQSGATFVIVDKTSNPRDGSPALLIQDDGGGMDPEAMRRCMSFGFSDKKSQFAIGQYGNGVKTSTMRLGADAIVFSCHLNNRILTQSIGLLSYTYLTQTQLDRIVVPMVNYEFDTFTESLKVLNGNEHFMSNLSLLLRWSPYSSEADLLKQFDDIGPHGTKVIIYNLWCNDDGSLELDFDTDSKDIRIAGDIKRIDTLKAWKSINENHIANQFRYSLRVYLSILYLKIPARFQIMLRGKVVKLHNIADDLKYPQFVKYAPLIDGSATGTALTVTTIGFLKEAPQVNIHGFNVYHKNRLILLSWNERESVSRTLARELKGKKGQQVLSKEISILAGCILQADFIEPTHNKQDFERTSLFQKLEVRLKQMTWEYWDTHCTLFGYKEKRKIKPGITSMQKPVVVEKPVVLNKRSSSLFNAEAYGNSFQCSKNLQRLDQGSQNKRKHTHELVNLLDTQKLARTDIVTSVEFNQNKQQVGSVSNVAHFAGKQKLCAMIFILILQIFAKLSYGLHLFPADVANLKSKIQKAQDEYKRLLAEAKDLDVKEE